MNKWKLIVRCEDIHTNKMIRAYIETLKFKDEISYDRMTVYNDDITLYGKESDLDVIDNKIINALYMYSDLSAETIWEKLS